MAVVALLLTVDGVDVQMLGVTVSAIAADWGLPLSAFGAAMAAGHLGSAIGAATGGLAADVIGRRPTMLLGVAWFGTFMLATLVARTPEEIAIARVLAGIGLGGTLPPALALISEILPARLRPLGVSLAILTAPLGVALAGLSAAAMLPAFGWRAMYLVFGLLPFVVAIIALAVLPESPTYLARFPERRQQLQRVLARFAMEARPETAGPKTRRAGIGALLSERSIEILSIFAGFFFAYISISLIFGWMPALFTRNGFSPSLAGVVLSVFATSGMAGIIVAGVLMSAFGTRPIALSYILGSACAIAALTFALPASPAALGDGLASFRFYGAIAVAGFLLNGVMTSLFAHAAATFPDAVRATGLGFAATSGRVGAICGSFFGAQIVEIVGPSAFFSAVAGLSMLTFLLLIAGAATAPKRSAPSVAPN
ncbi:MAG: MFS transporter [Hyphomonadaceae bacterium]|nr:MFS transporter [Hyphomonadaceae bacterium]